MPNRKNILIILPRSQHSEEELQAVRKAVDDAGARWVALSKSGRESAGTSGGRFSPTGMIVDWDKQPSFAGKYDAVVLVGGRGARKSLWEDPIVPQILTDHHRAGKWIAACGLAVAVLARAGFLAGEASGPVDDPDFLAEMERAQLALAAEPVTRAGNVLTGRGGDRAEDFGRALYRALSGEVSGGAPS